MPPLSKTKKKSAASSSAQALSSNGQQSSSSPSRPSTRSQRNDSSSPDCASSPESAASTSREDHQELLRQDRLREALRAVGDVLAPTGSKHEGGEIVAFEKGALPIREIFLGENDLNELREPRNTLQCREGCKRAIKKNFPVGHRYMEAINTIKTMKETQERRSRSMRRTIKSANEQLLQELTAPGNDALLARLARLEQQHGETKQMLEQILLQLSCSAKRNVATMLDASTSDAVVVNVKQAKERAVDTRAAVDSKADALCRLLRCGICAATFRSTWKEHYNELHANMDDEVLRKLGNMDKQTRKATLCFAFDGGDRNLSAPLLATLYATLTAEQQQAFVSVDNANKEWIFQQPQ